MFLTPDDVRFFLFLLAVLCLGSFYIGAIYALSHDGRPPKKFAWDNMDREGQIEELERLYEKEAW